MSTYPEEFSRLETRAENAEKLCERLIETLKECEEYFDQRADAEYHLDRAAPIGNEEMQMLTIVRAALADAGKRAGT